MFVCGLAAACVAAVLACSSEAGGGSSSGSTPSKPTTFTPVEAPSQNPLPPGAGTKDGSTVVLDTGIDTGPVDTGAPVDAGGA